MDKKALAADFYFTSANAVSLDGHIVNIDGTGNRTAATCFGPKHVVYVIGKNKITNRLEEALRCAKNTAVNLQGYMAEKLPAPLPAVVKTAFHLNAYVLLQLSTGKNRME